MRFAGRMRHRGVTVEKSGNVVEAGGGRPCWPDRGQRETVVPGAMTWNRPMIFFGFGFGRCDP